MSWRGSKAVVATLDTKPSCISILVHGLVYYSLLHSSNHHMLSLENGGTSYMRPIRPISTYGVPLQTLCVYRESNLEETPTIGGYASNSH